MTTKDLRLEERREYNRLHRLAFPERWRVYNKTANDRRYRIHRESHLGRCKIYRVKNRDRLRAWHRMNWRKNKEKRHASIVAARAKRPEHYKLLRKSMWIKRHAKINNAPIVDCRLKIKELEKEANCHWCHIELNPKNRSVDHIIALARGGKHHPDNLVASCRKCNCMKGALLPEEWWERQIA